MPNQSTATPGQASLEFLTTYGWAIMLLLAVAVVLFWLGVANPRTMVSSTCAIPSDMACRAFSINTTGVLAFDLAQSTGKPINITAVRCTQETNPVLSGPDVLASPITIRDGKHEFITDGTQRCRDSSGAIVTGTAGSIYKGKIYIQYRDIDLGLPHTIVAEVVLKYEDIEMATGTP